MQKLRIALSILVLPFAFHSVQAQTAETKAGMATVAGRVVMKGESAQGVLVYLHPISQPTPSNPDTYLRARTDEGGHFRITGVAAGDYFIIPLAPGFVYSGGDETGLRRKTLKVSEGVNIENIDVDLYRGGVITGRVVDSQGRPLVGKFVLLSRFDKSGWSSPNTSYGVSFEMYVTDDRGVYRIYGLPVGRYLVSVGFPPSAGQGAVSRDGTFYPRTFHPKAANESEAKTIEVTEGSESVGVDITVLESKLARSISGRVIDADTGQPAEGIDIAYNAISDSRRYINHWRSDGVLSGARGEFSLKGMAPGKYQLVARPESESEFFSDPTPCDLSDGDVAGVEIKVRRGGSISGVVVIEGTDDPKALAKLPELYLYVNVWRDGSDEQRRDNPKVNADGSFQVRGLPQSYVHITYNPKSKGNDFSLARIEHNGAVVRDVIWAGPGKHVTGVRVVLAYNGRKQ
jgi:Carboxypeptidase regulatory-like domain